ncbi:hypothetical protein [Phenylobacterium sp. SCN 70-31]|uniref:hypothetical protein n=1 Tax=Phenylobacterium sp. SCN 70-31 TaxID=1660129 RepID=UPI0025D08181|nr:hypothetical protein [Phenylobacterium sp. SCN 70-31]
MDLERRAVDAAEKQVAEAVAANQWAPRNFHLAFVQALATIASVVFTAWAAIAAAQAARSARIATDAIPVLERAYVYALIDDDVVDQACSVAERLASGQPNSVLSTSTATPLAKVRFKNFGKTPAKLIYGEVSMSLIGSSRVGSTDDLPIKNLHILAEGESTETTDVYLETPLTWSEVKAIRAGSMGLYIGGAMRFEDIWGIEHTAPVAFSYNTALKRFTANLHRQQKPKHGLLSRFLPSHWWESIST